MFDNQVDIFFPDASNSPSISSITSPVTNHSSSSSSREITNGSGGKNNKSPASFSTSSPSAFLGCVRLLSAAIDRLKDTGIYTCSCRLNLLSYVVMIYVQNLCLFIHIDKPWLFSDLGYQRLDLVPDHNNPLPVKGQIVISLLSRDGHGTGNSK